MGVKVNRITCLSLDEEYTKLGLNVKAFKGDSVIIFTKTGTRVDGVIKSIGKDALRLESMVNTNGFTTKMLRGVTVSLNDIKSFDIAFRGEESRGYFAR